MQTFTIISCVLVVAAILFVAFKPQKKQQLVLSEKPVEVEDKVVSTIVVEGPKKVVKRVTKKKEISASESETGGDTQ